MRNSGDSHDEKTKLRDNASVHLGGGLREELERRVAGGAAFSSKIKHDLLRAYTAMREERTKLGVTAGEVEFLAKALKGTVIDPRLLWAHVSNLDVDQPLTTLRDQLSEQIRRLSPLQTLALLDQLEQAWVLPYEGRDDADLPE